MKIDATTRRASYTAELAKGCTLQGRTSDTLHLVRRDFDGEPIFYDLNIDEIAAYFSNKLDCLALCEDVAACFVSFKQEG